MTDFPPQIESFPGICSECNKEALVVNAYAVTVGKSERLQPCAGCLEKVRKGELRPQIRRLYAAGEVGMFQLLKPGQGPDVIPNAIEGEAAGLIAELAAMVQNDPSRGTQFESAFLDDHTMERTRAIGWRLYELGGHPLMVAAHDMIRAAYGPSARSLEVCWDGCGEWFD